MDALKALSSLHCELKIMNARNILLANSSGYLFVRCYLSAGNKKRVRVDSREVSSNGDLSWNESFSLDCQGTKQSMDMITHGTIVLELRWRSNSIALFGRSQLVGRAEVSWRDVFESPNMEMKRWVMMDSKKKGVKVPSVCVGMKINEVLSSEGMVVRKMNKWDESCGCCHGDCCNNTYIDSEFFLIGAALEAF
ncbi:putative C2 domain superfamily protein [Helianthus annuus]|nr:putative C2 domain superfamily protein [Helianthus annuus]